MYKKIALAAFAYLFTVLEAQAQTEPPATEKVEHEETGNSSSGPTSSPFGTVAIDPLGFLLFGPTASVELGVDKWSGTLGFRWFSPGVLAGSLFLSDTDAFAFSYGLAGRGQYYFQGGTAGPHLGVAFEYLHIVVDNEDVKIVTTSSYLVPQLDGGYRHRMGPVFLGIGLSLGYAIQAAAAVDNLPGGTDAQFYEAKDESSVFGSARFEFGMYFWN